jgi:hypothetical protein
MAVLLYHLVPTSGNRGAAAIHRGSVALVASPAAVGVALAHPATAH